MAILKQTEADTPISELCRELEMENQRLKKMYAQERLKAEIARGAVSLQKDSAMSSTPI